MPPPTPPRSLSAAMYLPDPDKRVRNPGNELALAGYKEGVRRNVPGQWTDNRYEQSNHLTGVIALAIFAVMKALKGSTACVYERRGRKVGKGMSARRVRKALPTPHAHPDDQEWVPARRGHPLTDLFAYVNETQSLSDLLGMWVIQRKLTGTALIYAAETTSRSGCPAEMWVIPTALAPGQPVVNEYYPCGYYRVNNYYAGGVGYVPGFLGGGGAILDARDVLAHRYPHPLWGWDGYSPLTAGGVQIDLLEAIDVARKSAMDGGTVLDGVYTQPGMTQDQADSLKARFTGEHGGKRRHRGVAFLDGDAGEFTPFNASPVDMDFPQGWEQMVKFVLALLGVPPAVAGITEATSYAQLFAARQQFYTNELRPEAKDLSDFLTKHLALKYFGADTRIQIDVPPLDDHELQERQLDADAKNNAIRVNEIRALRGREPWPDGDVTPAEYAAKAQGGGTPGGPEGDPADGGDSGADASPLDALGDEVLLSLGLGGPDGGGDGDQPHDLAKAFDPSKFRRGNPKNAGQFAPKGQGGYGPRAGGPAGSATKVPSPPAPGPGDSQATAEAAKKSPAVTAAVRRLASRAEAMVANLHAKAISAGLDPAAVLDTVDDWSRIFVTKHADAVAQHLGVSSWTAAQVLSHLVGHAVAAVKKHLQGGSGVVGGGGANAPGKPGESAAKVAPAGPPHPDNPAARGSLPPRPGVRKALGGVEVAARLDALIESL